MPLKIYMPVPQPVRLFGDGVFTEDVKMRSNPLGKVTGADTYRGGMM